MDVSIVAAIGSFIVSERVIKAKATVLFGLLCTVVYDLFIHSNDPVSLRVYRGERYKFNDDGNGYFSFEEGDEGGEGRKDGGN